MQFRRAEEVLSEVVEGRAILLDAAGTELITLNPTGTLIWGALDGPTDLDTIVDRVLPSLDGVTREQLREDAEAFVRELRDIGLVVEGATG